MFRIFVLFFMLFLFDCKGFADSQNVFVQVRFSRDVKFSDGSVREYQSALYYDLDEYPKISLDDIEKEEQKMADKWRDNLENVPPPIPLTKEDLIVFISDVETQLFDLESKKIILQNELDEISPPTKEELQERLDKVVSVIAENQAISADIQLKIEVLDAVSIIVDVTPESPIFKDEKISP